jgi:hypothetical protein
VVGKANSINESEMALFHECTLQCAQKDLDSVDIVREAMLQQAQQMSWPRGPNDAD